MAKISDEIRELANTYYSGRKAYKTFTAFADRIDNEMVELPKDADGVPIHVGDTLYNSGKKYVVTCIFTDYCDHSFALYANDNESVAYNPEAFTHTRPDSWERIANELDAWVDRPASYKEHKEFHTFADRIRKLAEKEDK